MNKENNEVLTRKFNELKDENTSQDEINRIMGELYDELLLEEMSLEQAKEEARFETYLEGLPDEKDC